MSTQPMIIEGRVWLFPEQNINTDLIMPQVVFRMPIEEQVKHVFAANRPGWAAMVKRGDIIIGGRNFGTGSSRPGALMFKRMGIAALAAESINGLFYRNSINYALPAIECRGICSLAKEGETVRIDFSAGTIANVASGEKLIGRPMPAFLQAIVQAGGVIPRLRAEGYL